jgi:hypothetical protein
MPNKHFCQGPNCHTYPTTDRYLKSKGIIRGRYAYAEITSGADDEDKRWHRYDYRGDTYFCSQGCKMDWLNENMSAIEMGIPVPFIRERRFTEGYKKVTTTHEGYNGTYKTSSLQRVDNNAES